MQFGCVPEKKDTGTALSIQAEMVTTAEVTNLVNTFIGTTNEGNTHPGAVVPWGITNMNPQTKNFRERATGPASYEFGDPYIYGFSTVNISGIGCPAAGSVPFKFTTGNFSDKLADIRSKYSKEISQPGYYKVFLEKHKAKVEMTATQRTGVYRFTTSEDTKHIYVDLGANMSHKKGGEISILEDYLIVGFQNDGNFCGAKNNRKIYFAVQPTVKPDTIRLIKDGEFIKNDNTTGKSVGAVMSYHPNSQNTILDTRIGISFVSIENAIENVLKEQNYQSFDFIKMAALQKWENKLSVVNVSGGSETDKTMFYTALYHALQVPQVYNDVNGEYRAMESDSIMKSDFTRYSVFSLWDTYRTLHPLLTLLYPEEQTDMLRSMTAMYEESGWLPKWELFGQETGVMVGDPASIVIADSYLKGLRNFDAETALEAMKKSALRFEENPLRPGVEQYWNYGYIPIDDRGGDPMKFSFSNGVVWGPVSTTLEYNLADYGIASMAKIMGENQVHEKFLKQSMSFKKLFDQQTNFFRPKKNDGTWYEPFNPLSRYGDIQLNSSGGLGFTEGTAWHYRFFAPHAMNELIELYGEKEFLSSLDSLFYEEYYDMTNEPDISFPFLYNYIEGFQQNTQKQVLKCIETYFNHGPNGLPGNDDAGTLSAWLVFAMMGIYPDAPGVPKYQITVPRFDAISVRLDNRYYKGTSIKINKKPKIETAKNLKVNGVSYDYFQVSHEMLISGATIELY